MGVTAAERKAAAQLKEIAKYNAGSTTIQLANQLGDYDLSDKHLRAAAGVQKTANSKQSATDRFAQLKSLQSSTRGVLAGAGNALQGSQLGSLSGMLADRNDLDTAEGLGTLAQNQNQVENSLTESLNANVMGRRGAIDSAAFGLRGIEADLAAQLSGLDPSLYGKPAGGLGSSKTNASRAGVKQNAATKSGYFLPAAVAKPAGTTMPGTSYFDKLMNLYNRRSA